MPFLTLELHNETHPVLNQTQLREITDFRAAIMYKSKDQTMKLLYEWTKTGKLNYRQFQWATTYVMHDEEH